MRKIYKTLTDDQKERGVIFSSQLMPGSTIHEVTRKEYQEDYQDADETIARLLDDKFFNGSPYKYNLIRK